MPGSTLGSTPGSATTASAAARVTPGQVFGTLDQYWSATFPAVLGRQFEPLRGGWVGVDSGATGGTAALCLSSPAQIAGNAYYCPDADGIVYDTGVLVPVLRAQYGVPGLLAALAHEYGHAVAARLGVPVGGPLTAELRADCLAGTYLSWALTASAPFGLTPDALLAAVAPLLDFADQITVLPTDVTAHGLGIDRAQAVLLGFRSGLRACRDFDASSVTVVQGRFPAGYQADDRYPSNAAVIAAAQASLAALRPGLPAAEPDHGDLVAAQNHGQFAVATATVLAVAAAAGRSRAEGACFAGAWTAAVLGGPAGALGSRLSDPDAALSLIRSRPLATTAELTAFIDGFAAGCP